MNRHWRSLVNVSLVAFAGFAGAWQCVHRDEPGAGLVPESSITLSWRKGVVLAKIHDLVPRVGACWPGVGSWWTLDLVLPEDARVFMTDMTGPTNYSKIMYYYFATYYLFPREIGVSVDRPTRIAKDGFPGETSRSDQEILARGYDVRLDIDAGETMHYKALRELKLKEPVNPEWFDSAFDAGIAFVLPLFTALAGMWLFRFLFSSLAGQMPLPEQLACGLGLGMMAVASFTLGVKLCGFHGYHLVYVATGLGALAEIWRNRRAYGTGMADGCRNLARQPVAIAILAVGGLVFLMLFRLAGLQGVVDYDATMGWLLKAKILHLYAGNELVQWFSNPRLANAHLDYPPLVSALHAATYDSLGHVDEFVTKFWPAWMLLLLLAALAATGRGGKKFFYAPHFGLLGLLLLPATQKYVQMEGATLPMVFFTVLGFVQCAVWLVERDPARLGLGLTLLFGAAMTKFEGSIFLVFVLGWILLVPAARPPLPPAPGFWRAPVFCGLVALAYAGLRLQIPSVNYESNWAGHVLSHPVTALSMLSNWIRFFLIELARLFVNPDFANWNGEGGQLHWIGRWNGLVSLYNPSTLGLTWLCFLMTLAVWFVFPARRQAVVWILTMFIAAVAALSGVFASFAGITDLDLTMGYTADAHGARYLLPAMLAWFATTLILLYRDDPANPAPPLQSLAPRMGTVSSRPLSDGPSLSKNDAATFAHSSGVG